MLLKLIGIGASIVCIVCIIEGDLHAGLLAFISVVILLTATEIIKAIKEK